MPERFFAPASEADTIKVGDALSTGYTRFELTYYAANEDCTDSAY
jgi:hypothetical protein